MRAVRKVEVYGLAAHRPNPYKLACQAVARWNECYPIGTLVHVDGSVTRTLSRAEVVEGYLPAVWIHGFDYAFALDQLHVVDLRKLAESRQ